MELSGEEKQMKDLWERHRDAGLDRLLTLPELQRILEGEPLPIDPGEYLSDAAFIPEGENLAVVRHLRYLPAILHTHTFFELLYVEEGSCTHYIEHGEQKLVRGDLCLVAPHKLHAVSAFGDGDILWNVLLGEKDYPLSLAANGGENPISSFFLQARYGVEYRSALIVRCGDDPSVRDFVSYIRREYEGRAPYRQEMLSNLVQALFILLLRKHPDDILIPEGSDNPAGEQIINILGYIRRNYRDLSLSGVASHFGYSERHVTRLLQQATGRSFRDIVRGLRLGDAAELLKNTALPVEIVAQEAGYADLENFRQQFEEAYHCTPSAYRKK